MERKEIIGEFGYNKGEIKKQIEFLKDVIDYHKRQLKIWKDAYKEVQK